jgi:hypothetical protein
MSSGGITVLGQGGSRGVGGRNIALVAAILFGYVFGSTAWGQAAGIPTGVRVTFTLAFALLGFGLPWLVYLAIKLLSRLARRGPRP